MGIGYSDMRASDPVIRLWRELCFAKRPMTLDELRDAADVSADLLVTCIGSWSRMHCVRASADRFGFEVMSKAVDFQTPPTDTAEHEDPVTRQNRKQMWAAIRVLKHFDLPSLLMASGVEESAAKTYLKALEANGYLFAYRSKKDPTDRWYLQKWTGPLHPRFADGWVNGEARQLVFDPNQPQPRNPAKAARKKFAQGDSPCLSV